MTNPRRALRDQIIALPDREAKPLDADRLKIKRYPGSLHYKKKDRNGDPVHGRHSGLQSVPQLAEADLVYVPPKTISEAEALITALKTYSP